MNTLASLQAFDASDDAVINVGRSVVSIETQALGALAQRMDASFVAACRLFQGCQGRVVVCGMGKSGHVGGKLAATLASTGTPAFFVHPGEAGHGDLGMITPNDVVLLISYSGQTRELLTLLPMLQRMKVPMVAITGNMNSRLAMASDVVLNGHVEEEACPMGLAPTSSTTVAMALGDALAIALLHLRGFTSEDFAKAHPEGQLGHRLLSRVSDVMASGERLPRTYPHQTVSQALLEMTKKRLGMTLVLDPHNDTLTGIFTDGDLRRTLESGVDLHATAVGDVMTANPVTIQPAALVEEARNVMTTYLITSLAVTDIDRRVMGVVHLHDLLTMEPSDSASST